MGWCLGLCVHVPRVVANSSSAPTATSARATSPPGQSVPSPLQSQTGRQPTCEHSHSQMCKLFTMSFLFQCLNLCDGRCNNFCLPSRLESVGYSCYCCSTNGVTGQGKVFLVIVWT